MLTRNSAAAETPVVERFAFTTGQVGLLRGQAKIFVLQIQFEKGTASTILTVAPKEAVKNIVVPKVDKSAQQPRTKSFALVRGKKIAGLVQKSHEARKKAKELLKEAKQKVEKLIDLI